MCKVSLILPSLAAIFATTSLTIASPKIQSEHLSSKDASWKFNKIPNPSKSDIANKALINITAGGLDNASARAEALVNGQIPDSPNNLSQSTFFATLSSFVIDLGKQQPVAAIHSYSWHEFDADQGARGPQFYTVSGSADQVTWTKIADVDTRPNKTGEGWSGQYAASISDTTGKLGDFRYLKFDIKPTYSPKQSNALWTNTFFNEIDVHTKDSLAKAGDATIAKPIVVTDVWLVFKTHFDIGFTDLAENVFDRYRVEMMDKALAVMDQNRTLPANQRFSWTVPGWPLDAIILGPKQDPERKKRVEQAVREGALVPHALAATTHTESLDLESLVRSLSYTSHIARTYDRPLPISGKATDVPSHSWIMPTLMAHAGIKFFHMGCNPASQFPRVPKLFWWQGPDGSRVLSAYTLDYGSSLTPPADWPSRHYLAMIMTGDNHGPPSVQDVENYRKQLQASMPNVRVHFATLDDYARAVLEENPDLPVIRGDMPDTWIHGLLANPTSTKSHQNTQPLEPALDALDTTLKLWNIATPTMADSLAKAYEQTFLYGEHTWGMNAEYGPRRAYGDAWKNWLVELAKEPAPADGDYSKLPRGSKRKWMQSYQDHRNYAFTAETIIQKELKTRLDLLAANVQAEQGSTVVYNPLPWKRSGILEINGKRVFAKDVPAGGYITLKDPSSSSEQIDPAATTFETPYFKVTFDLKRGGIASLVEKSTQRELIDTTSPYALGQFLHEHFSTDEVYPRFFHKYSRMQGGWGLNDIGKPGMPDAKDSPYKAFTPSSWTMQRVSNSVEDRVTLTTTDCSGLAKGYQLTFSFPRQQAWVDVDWQVTEKTAEKHPTGGWLCFPFAVENPQFTIGRTGAAINPAKDIIPGTNRHLMAVRSGAAITSGDTGTGAAICPIDTPLVSLGKPGLWHWTMDYVPTTPTAFVNLYNNMWNTNFPLWQEGSWNSRVRLWPVGKDAKVVKNLTVNGWEARLPLLGAQVSTTSGKLPATQQGVAISRPGVLLSAFGHNIDGKGTILRVWDQTGETADLDITIPGNFTKATPVDLRGENPSKPLPITDGKLTITLPAYSPASFILE